MANRSRACADGLIAARVLPSIFSSAALSKGMSFFTNTPAWAEPGRGILKQHLSLAVRPLHSESQTTLKLDPSEVSDDGTASSAPVVPLVMIDSFTAVPKLLIGPETEESVASLLPLMPV